MTGRNVLLYHYTFEKYLTSILKTGLRPSIRLKDDSKSDAQHGNGQYFTDLPPLITEEFTRAQVSQVLYKLPRKWGLTGKLQSIVYIEFELDKGIERVRDLFTGEVRKKYPNYGIWLYLNEEVLPETSITSSGIITFQMMASGNR